MNKKILVINSGSSSVKFKVFEYDGLKEIASGLCERIQISGGHLKVKTVNDQKVDENIDLPSHEIAINYALKALQKLNVIKKFEEIVGIGHRVVMGGEEIVESCLATEKNFNIVSKYNKLAPLHHVFELQGVKAFEKMIPSAKNVFVFDTSFHHTMPAVNYDYCLSRKLTKKYDIRRYGMHGTSYRYITEKMQEVLHKDKVNLVVCHIGNGASICAVKDSQSYNTTMGLTPLSGLMMGTRCGDIDASVVVYLLREGLTVDQIDDELNRNSGIKAFCDSSDSRDLLALVDKGNKDAILCREIQVQRIVNYLVEYINQLENKVDAIVFTAGCGENDKDLSQSVINKIHLCKLEIDQKLNDQSYDDYIKISTNKSAIAIFKVRTNEELMIATDTKKLIG